MFDDVNIGKQSKSNVFNSITIVLCIMLSTLANSQFVFMYMVMLCSIKVYIPPTNWTRSFASLTSFSVMGRSVYQRVLVSLT